VGLAGAKSAFQQAGTPDHSCDTSYSSQREELQAKIAEKRAL